MTPFRRPTLGLFAALMLCALGGAAAAAADPPIAVTPDNFTRAESDLYFSGVVKDGGFGKFMHRREPTPIAKQTVIRMNRDTLYSAAVFDLDAGPVTITLPDAGKRFVSMQVIDEDEYSPEVVYGAVVRTLTREGIGTRYVLAAVRILVDPNDPKDVEAVHALQDAIKISQPGGPGTFTIPNWDASSQTKVRGALLELASTIPDTKGMFGPKDKVDPVRHLIGSAAAWGGNPEQDALYLNVTPAHNDGKTIYRLVSVADDMSGLGSARSIPQGEQKQKKRTIDVLPKPDNLIRYRQKMSTAIVDSGARPGNDSLRARER